MRLSLRAKAVVVVGLILFLALGINTAVLTGVASDRYRTAILDKSSVVGAALQAELMKVLNFGVPLDSLEGVDLKLKDIADRDMAIGYARVVSTGGRVYFHSDPASQGKVLDDVLPEDRFQDDGRVVTEGRRYFEISHPLRDPDDRVIGMVQIGVRAEAITGPLYRLLFLALAIALASFVVAVILVYVSIGRTVARPILAMKDAAEKIAAGDLASLVEVKGGDEISLLGRSINQITLNLRDMITKVRGITRSISRVAEEVGSSSTDILMVADTQKGAVEDTAGSVEQLDQSVAQVAASANSLSESTEETSSAIAQMIRSIGSVAQSAVGVYDSAQDTATSIEEMATNIGQITGNLQILSEASEAVSSSVAEVDTSTKEIEQRATESVALAEDVKVNATEKGLAASGAARAGMEDIRQSVTALSDTVNILGKRSAEIGKIVKVINEITEQTNLLSLNAAILAAQAGEHGKGFSVVAENIGDLAEATTVSTKEISELISSVQTETGASVRKAAEGLESVEKGIGLVADVDEALTAISKSAKTSLDMAGAIQRATSEQTQVIRHISGSVQDMASQVDHIAGALEEQNKGSRLIITATETMKEISDHVKNATAEQRDGSTYITRAVDNMSGQVTQIAAATGKQKKESLVIVESMNSVKDATGKFVASSHRMNDAIKSLQDEAQNLQDELKRFET